MDNIEAILKKRAVEAARKVASTGGEKGREMIVFNLGDERYAIDAESLGEVYPYAQPTPIPHLPPYIQGIVHVRGRFVSIVDLGRFLGIEASGSRTSGAILLIGKGEMEFGVAVDEVLEQSRFPESSIRPVPPGFSLPRPDLIVGVSEEGIIVLSAQKVLGDPAMRIYQDVATSYKGSIYV